MYAFPMGEYFDDDEKEMKQQHGMLLRDYIAIKAMPIVAAQLYTMGREGTVPKLTAKISYEFADAMLEARKQ